MGSRAVCIQRVAPPCFKALQVKKSKTVRLFSVNIIISRKRRSRGVRCSIADFIGGDLVKPDTGRWFEDVEKHKAIAIYTSSSIMLYLVNNSGPFQILTPIYRVAALYPS
ncbi:unnamed protein product [Brassica napus]|uniref:(rape) hypothetical protein n=1 Tax=Brassica napus TaxID=3708 RepID=A0A817BGI1_BRANA|nr:unnamed protein product [Brassica napus]